MNDKPIIFSAPMVRALLEGRKTQTRRVFVPPAPFDPDDDISIEVACEEVSPRFKRGDRLWVREEWSGTYAFRDTPPSQRCSFAGEGVPFFREEIWYWADGSPEYGDWEKPRPSIHMPRWASRLTLTVTDVRVQRVQEISREDCVAEGCNGWVARDGQDGLSPEEDFQDLWNSINEKRGHGWNANPWVAALTFDVHRCNIDQMPVDSQ